tara:strand:- start:1201 stop:2004 length:804 start_codon:yes stop_codon:yes gene_type:complete
MNKDAYYFSHDSNARNDQRLMKVRMKYGMQGYGIYFGIIEILREQADYTLAFDDLESIAFDLRVELNVIEDIVSNYELFEIQDEVFYSKSLKRRLECLDKKKQIRSEAGRKGGRATQAKAKQKSSNAKAVKESKLDKSKEYNNKVNDIKSLKSINTEYLEQLQKKHTDIDVKFQFERFKNNLDAKGVKYKNYRAAFNNWVTSDYCKPSSNGVKKKLHFEMPDGRNYIAYCSECNGSDFYEPFGFNPDIIESKCCSAKILNKRSKVNA